MLFDRSVLVAATTLTLACRGAEPRPPELPPPASAAETAPPDSAPAGAPAAEAAPLPPAASAAATAVTVGATDRLLLSGKVVTPGAVFNGQVLVVGNRIACAAPSCASEPGANGATLVTTGGTILPGLIDAHNHGLFNIFDEQDWRPTKFYKNHNLWTAEARYKDVVDAKQFLEGAGDVRCELDKYAEVKALIAGTTSMIVAPGAQQPACFASIVRTIDTSRNDLGTDKIQSAISVPNEAAAQKACQNMADGKLDAYVVHTGEGVDETSRKEFDRLTTRAGGCLKSSKTTVVHGTALGTPEFTTMAAAGMSLVWSPKSNMFLYDDTTKIPLAVQAGVKTIALAPDWALGGSINMLDELRFADQVDTTKFGNVLTAKRLFEMATIDAARALGVASDLGSIEAGKRADLLVVAGNGDPYDALLATRPESVRLVLVDGRMLYGDQAFKAAAPPPGCESLDVCGTSKALCIAEASSADKLDQTYTTVRQILSDALARYDTSAAPAGGPLSPLAPLTRCQP